MKTRTITCDGRWAYVTNANWKKISERCEIGWDNQRNTGTAGSGWVFL